MSFKGIIVFPGDATVVRLAVSQTGSFAGLFTSKYFSFLSWYSLRELYRVFEKSLCKYMPQ